MRPDTDGRPACTTRRLGSARIGFTGDAALLKGGVPDLAKGLDRLQIPRVAESARTLALELDAARVLQDEVRQALESLSGMSELESLRLQMALDRLAKMMSTLSNVLKASSDTTNTIIRNLQ